MKIYAYAYAYEYAYAYAYLTCEDGTPSMRLRRDHHTVHSGN